MFKKKRRAPPGPSKNEKKIQREQLARSAGLLKHLYPQAQSVTVDLAFLTPQRNPLDQETRVFHPSDACNFVVPCPGRCGQGSFDLSAKLRSVIERRETFSESVGVCMEPLFGGSKEPCGIELRCRIKTVFNP